MKLGKMIEVCCDASPGPWDAHSDTAWIIKNKDGNPVAQACCCGGFVRFQDSDFVEMARTQIPKLLEFVGQAEHAAQQLLCRCSQDRGPCVRCWIEKAKTDLESD